LATEFILAVHFTQRQYTAAMIFGAHLLLYSNDPEADRAFFKTTLGFPSIDIGDGWLLFALPPAELAVHPSEGNSCRCMRNVRWRERCCI
jgi:hypothetical protein